MIVSLLLVRFIGFIGFIPASVTQDRTAAPNVTDQLDRTLPPLGRLHSLALFKQPRQDSHQCPLLADGKTSEGGGWCGHAIEQKRAEPRTGWCEIQYFYPA